MVMVMMMMMMMMMLIMLMLIYECDDDDDDYDKDDDAGHDKNDNYAARSCLLLACLAPIGVHREHATLIEVLVYFLSVPFVDSLGLRTASRTHVSSIRLPGNRLQLSIKKKFSFCFCCSLILIFFIVGRPQNPSNITKIINKSSQQNNQDSKLLKQ